MPDLKEVIERLEGSPVLAAIRARDPNRPTFAIDQLLVVAVEAETKRRRVTLAEAVSFAEGYQHALSALQEREGEG